MRNQGYIKKIERALDEANACDERAEAAETAQERDTNRSRAQYFATRALVYSNLLGVVAK
jgi:hypothetical protein